MDIDFAVAAPMAAIVLLALAATIERGFAATATATAGFATLSVFAFMCGSTTGDMVFGAVVTALTILAPIIAKCQRTQPQ